MRITVGICRLPPVTAFPSSNTDKWQLAVKRIDCLQSLMDGMTRMRT